MKAEALKATWLTTQASRRCERIAAIPVEEFDLWLACWTQQEIADAVGVPRKTIEDVFGEIGNVAKPEQTAANHADDDPHTTRSQGGLFSLVDVPIGRESSAFDSTVVYSNRPLFECF